MLRESPHSLESSRMGSDAPNGTANPLNSHIWKPYTPKFAGNGRKIMSLRMIEAIKTRMSEKSTEELLAIWTHHYDALSTDQAIAIRRVLTDRHVAVPIKRRSLPSGGVPPDKSDLMAGVVFTVFAVFVAAFVPLVLWSFRTIVHHVADKQRELEYHADDRLTTVDIGLLHRVPDEFKGPKVGWFEVLLAVVFVLLAVLVLVLGRPRRSVRYR